MLQMRLSTNSSENSHQMDKMPFVKQEAVELCRICETVDNLLDISTEEFSHLYEKLHKIAEFEGDYSVWLKFICVTCGTKLENAFNFKIQCEDTFKKLVTQMENNVADPFFDNPFNEDCDPTKEEISESIAQQRAKSFFEIYELPESNVENNSHTAMNRNSYDQSQLQQQNYNQNLMDKRRSFTNSAFSGGSSLKMVAMRNAEKPKNQFSCAICSETFKEKWKMREHMQRVHMVKKRNICGNCGEKQCVCNAMSRHSQRGTEKPFQCNVCGRGFRTKSYMELHEKEHDVSSKLRSLLNQGTSSAYEQMEQMDIMNQTLQKYTNANTAIRPSTDDKD
uniref:Uncharacterized protein n=1 Tax=Lutzomyia longipalpis TaxID=7200 RepID=A0A1B0CS42_LUTLO